MDASRHTIMDGRVQLYPRPNSPFWWFSCSVNAKQVRRSTGEESLTRAKDVARDLYLTLLGKVVAATVGVEAAPAPAALDQMGKYLADELRNVGRKRNIVKAAGPTFAAAGEIWEKQYPILTEGERSPKHVSNSLARLNNHLLPFFRDKMVTEITRATARDYLVARVTPITGKDGKVIMDKRTGKPWRPSRSTLHQEMVVLRLVLEAASSEGWLSVVPKLTMPYKASNKISHRGWFSHDEYDALYKRTAERAKKPPHNRGRWKEENEDLHDYVLFMTNTGLRPDEAKLLQLRDITIVDDDATGEQILEIAVRGKRGTGWCKSMPGAVFPFKRMVARHKFEPKDVVFGEPPRELLNSVLEELDLKFDREGNRRTSYSFRHTYITMRLMQGADIYQVAKNCRTSVEMIEKHYAVHIKDMIDASAVNRRKPKPVAKAVPPKVKAGGKALVKKVKKSTEFIQSHV